MERNSGFVIRFSGRSYASRLTSYVKGGVGKVEGKSNNDKAQVYSSLKITT